MKKLFLIAVIAVFSLSACVPEFLGGGQEEAPPAAEAVDVNATVDAEASTQAAQTLAALDQAQATPTLEPATPTEEMPATAIETLTPTEESTATPEEEADTTPEADEATTGTPAAGTDTPDEATATLDLTATPEITETPAPTATSVYPSPTSPISINLPPESLVPYRRIEVYNRTKGKIYISLQGFTEYDYKPVIEYDIPRLTTVKYRVPQGYYKIVVYVGKDPMIDYVTINKNTNLRITIRKDELRIEK